MKLFVVCTLSLLLFSCYHNSSDREEIDQLKQRIISLEQKLDALTNGRTVAPMGLDNRNNAGTSSYSAPIGSNRCQALTKKGTQCKRKAKGNGYCWQHGG
jgi:hypothetical protein